MSTPICPKCNSNSTFRVDRKGFLAKHIYPVFGLFPWECTFCWKIFRAKNRGPRAVRRKSSLA
jgi:hypothetical protein